MFLLDFTYGITKLYVMLFGIVFGFIAFLLILGLIAKFFRFFTYHFSSIKVQKGELIKKKMFKCSDLYELKWKGEINEKGSHIILYIHDFIGNRNDSESMSIWFENKDSNFSVVSYDQRSSGDNIIENDPNYGANISDLKEIISELHERYPNQKIILIGHGYGASLAMICSNEKGVDKIIASSLKLIKGYKNTIANKSNLFWGWIFSSKAKINYYLDPVDLTDDSNFVNKLQKELELRSLLTVRQYYQMNHLLKKSIKKVNKYKNDKIIIFQSAKNIYSNTKKFIKITKSINIENIEVFKEQKYHLFNTKNNDIVFESLYKICKNI